ncbi:MAG: ABC transporter permease [Acidobacteriota bacterium]|nr:ABC transporter permease [Acidobacteriota bacterium]
MASLALKNLVHDKVRLAVTLVGIVFSVILAAVQLGIFQGFIAASTDIIANSKADLWITSTDVTHVEQGVEFSERKLYQVLSLEGVERAEKQIVSLGGSVKKPNGSSEGVTLVGFNLQGGMGGAWNIVRGSVKDLESPDAVLVDELYAADKLGVTEINQVIELNNRRARVVGFTRGIRIFTSQPAVFTSFKNAQSFLNLREDQTLYIVVKAKPETNLEELKEEIAAQIKDVDVWATDELVHQQMMYWVFGTGAGITVLIAAALAIIVGIVVVAQTIYAATIDHLKEYGTLKAMGATNFYLYRVIITQSVISGIIGYVLGIIVSLLISRVSMEGTLAIIVNWQLVAALFVTTILMCVGASIVSINKVTRIDPAMVFKG